MYKKEGTKEGSKGGVGVVCRLVILLMLSVGVFALTGCSRDSQVLTPDANNLTGPSKPDLGIFRNLVWVDPDETIPDSPPAPDGEKNADISNVVYGHSYYGDGKAGYIKYPGYPNGDNYTYTVAAWEVPEDGISNIYFKVLYRDGNGDYDSGSNAMVTNTNDYIYSWPAVTAHLNGDDKIVVDIVFQARANVNARWGIYHARSIQGTAQDFDSFPDATVSPFSMYAENQDCQHPDIVFDAFPDGDDDPPYNRLHAVFEVNAGLGNTSGIYYVKVLDLYESSTLSLAQWGSLSGESPSSYCERPRMDVGWDESDFTYIWFGVESIYYVGVVWNTMDFSGGIHANVEFTGVWAEYFYADPDVCPLTDDDNPYLNLYPYIEIDPVELEIGDNLRFTHVVWTHATLGSGQITDADVYGQYSGRILTLPPQLLVTQVEGRNAFPTFATLTAEIEHPWGWFGIGYLAWVHDDGPSDTDVEVYAGLLEYDKHYSQWLYYAGAVPNLIGGGDTSIRDPYVYGPDVAIFNEEMAMVVWTDFDGVNPNTILGDSSDWD